MPRISVVVVAVALPEARLVLVPELEPAHPLRALPEVEVGDEHARRAAVLGLERLAAVPERDPCPAAGHVLERKVGRVAAVGVLDDVIYRDELADLAADDEVDIRFTLTRASPEGWRGYRRRIDRELLEEVAWPQQKQPLVYVCGPTAFVEVAASMLVDLGHDAGRIKTERFGPTGV